ncbi:PAS domain S-box protein, partial [Patescibacteria group bacterium]|nr:PAS domain S-box protein [Patescibacteria group bacterium]
MNIPTEKTGQPLRLLFIEDNPDDFELAERTLRQEWLHLVSHCEQDAEGVARALKEFSPDIVISDYAMPKFDGLSALKLCRKILPGVPFILHTAALNDEAAVLCIRAGADDYVLKQNIAHLPLAVMNALERRRALLAERAAQDKLLQVSRAIEQSPVSVVITDTKGNIEYINPKFIELTGYSSEEVIGKNPNILKSGKHSDKFYADLWKTITSGEEWRGELENKKKNGEHFWESASISPVRNEQGKITHFLSVKEDITAQKLAEERAQHESDLFSQLISTIPDRIYFKDLQYRFVKVNDTLLRHFGLSDPTDVIGHTDADFFPEDYVKKSLADDAHVIETGQNLVGAEEVQTLRDGTTHWFSTTKVPLRDRDGKIIGLMGITRDITSLKATENQLRELNDQLQSALEHAGELAKKAEAANRAKSEFLAVMSHELRTPLNGVLGFAELLSYTPLDDEQKSYAQTISSSGTHLLSVVNDILDFSSIEKGRLTIQAAPFAIAGLVESSVFAARKAAVDKGLEFRCEMAAGIPEQIAGDERRIRQILINLLGNAVKFTSHGSVTLRVATPSAEGNPALDFSVEDTGIGIPPETINRLFQPFAQGDSTMSRPFGGTGLGLAISQRLAEAMGGSISVVSTPGKGSTFTLHLEIFPCVSSEPTSAPLSQSGILPLHLPKAPAPTAGGLVLVVEDDPENSRLAGQMLLSLGYRVEFAAQGAEAV